MTNSLKTAFGVFLCTFLSSACNQSAEKQAVEIKTDTITTPLNPNSPLVEPVLLKEMLLNEKTVIAGKRLSGSREINAEEYRSLSIKMIDSTAADEKGLKYHLVDTLFMSPATKVLLIGRAYESENFIWIAVYDGQNKLVDQRVLYYDNAEGFLSIETGIKDNKLTITSYSEFAQSEKDKKKTEIYGLNENNRIVIIK